MALGHDRQPREAGVHGLGDGGADFPRAAASIEADVTADEDNRETEDFGFDEQGFFEAEGLSVDLSREASWANVRDKVAVGALDGGHMLGPMTLAASMGVGGERTPMVVPMSLNLNGSAITISTGLAQAMRAVDPQGMAGHPRSARPLAKLIEEASALAMVGAKEIGVRLKFDISPEIGMVLADKVQIQQVVLNLMRNGVDAMHEAEVRNLVVSARPVADEMVEVQVSDTGPGISPDVADKLFQPFITTKRTGMGVGLSICRTIIEAHGGKIWFDSGETGGARFHFTLRAVPKEALATDA